MNKRLAETFTELFEELGHRPLHEENVTHFKSNPILSDAHPQWQSYARESLEELKGPNAYPDIAVQYDLSFDAFEFRLLDEDEFNRYRLATFRSQFYQDFTILPVNNYRVFCRNHEKECLSRAGQRHTLTFPDAEKIFGESEAPGDFGLNGSAGWKWFAYYHFLQDLLSKVKKRKLITLSVYDSLMIGGQITPVGKLLQSDKEANKKILVGLLKRKMREAEIPVVV